jgi:hypothetical protein
VHDSFAPMSAVEIIFCRFLKAGIAGDHAGSLGRAKTGRWNCSTTRSDLLGGQTSGPLETQVSTGLQTENPENAYLMVS